MSATQSVTIRRSLIFRLYLNELIVALFFLVTFNSCNKPRENSIPNLTPVTLGSLKTCKLIGNLGPSTMTIANGYLITRWRYNDPFLSIFNLRSGKKIGELGNDMKNPFLSGQSFKDSSTFFITDFGLNEHLTIKVRSDTITQQSIRRSKLPYCFVGPMNDVLKFDSSFYWGITRSTDENSRYFIFKTDRIHRVNNSSKVEIPVPSDDVPYYYYSYVSFNDKQNRVAAALKYFNRVEFYDGNGELKSICTENSTVEKLPPLNAISNPDAKLFYNWSYAGKKYFYASFVGESTHDCYSNKGGMLIRAFSWDGQFVGEVKLDRMNLGSFAVNESTNELYIISFLPQDASSPLLIYDLANNFK